MPLETFKELKDYVVQDLGARQHKLQIEVSALRGNENLLKQELECLRDRLERLEGKSKPGGERKTLFDNIPVLNINSGKVPYRVIKDYDRLEKDFVLRPKEIFTWEDEKRNQYTGELIAWAYPDLQRFLENLNMSKLCYLYVGE